MLISQHAAADAVKPADLPQQPIGTVLGYSYPTLQPLFDSGQPAATRRRTQSGTSAGKTLAGRNRYAVSNQWTLDWFNHRLLPEQQLQSVAVLQENRLGCYVRNDPKVPVQSILRTLVRMKMSGEIDEIVRLYIGGEPGGCG